MSYSCIMPGCSNQIQTQDDYCEGCQKHSKNVAASVDAKFANRPKKETKSDLQAFEESAKTYDMGGGRKIYLMKG